MKKRNIVIYRIVTGIFTAHMLFTIGAYFLMHDFVKEMFESLGVSSTLIYPLALAKLLGLIAIWSNKSRLLKELAYLGFAIDFIMAFSAHLMAGDGGAAPALVALIILLISYIYHRELFGKKERSVENL